MGCVLVYDNKIVGRGMNDTNRSMNVSDRLPLEPQTPLDLPITQLDEKNKNKEELKC